MRFSRIFSRLAWKEEAYILSSTVRVLVSCSNLIHSHILTSSVVKTTDSAQQLHSLESTMLTLICYVRDDNCKQAFEVEIDKAKSVSTLRDAIKEKTRPKFDDISADSLSLWKASVPINRDLKKCVEALNLVDDDSLYSCEILSDIFSSDLERKSVHIIIDCRHSGGLQLPMSLFNNTFFPKNRVTSGRLSAMPSASQSGPHKKTLQ